MSFRLSKEMMEEIAASTIHNRSRSILLVKSSEQAEKIAHKVREGIEQELPNWLPPDGRQRLASLQPPKLKPGGSNPTFVQMTHGGWVFVWPADDMGPEEDIGQPQFVYWPSEGGAYEKVTYELWQKGRLAGNVWRPVTISTAPKKTERLTAWERLLLDEDE